MTRYLLYFLLFSCICFTKSNANNDIKIKKIEISKNLIPQAPHEQTSNYKALIVIINKLSGISKQVQLTSRSKIQIPNNNLQIELFNCQQNFSSDVKEYLAVLKISNITDVANQNESINFEGEVSSEFIYKNPIQNSLIAINLLQCQND